MKSQEKRVHELDSLRGIAAMSVVILHFHDLFYYHDGQYQLQHKPTTLDVLLYPFYSGHEAVLLFFVLSGFVLSLPYLKGRQQPYPFFLARRVIRIYGPYLAGLALAVAGDAIWHGHLGLNQWADSIWSQPVSGKLVLQHIVFLGNYNWAQFNPVFWTLVYEMRISIVFPALFALVHRLSVRATILGVMAFALLEIYIAHGWSKDNNTAQTLDCTAMFIAGILMAKHREAVGNWYRRRSRMQQALFVCATFTLYAAGHLLPHMSKLAILLAILGWITLALNSDRTRRWLNHATPLYLGRISYSLYLVHIPILFTMAFTLNGNISRALFGGIYIVLAISGGSLFYWLIERPFVGLSHRVGRIRSVDNPATT